MIISALLEQDREASVLLCKRMKPEERLVAYFHHSQLMHQLYRAGLSHRSKRVPSVGQHPEGR